MEKHNASCFIRLGHGVGESVAVDTWLRGAGVYVCTHAHGDHTAGLSDSWAEGEVLCSAATRALLLLKWPSLASRTTALALDEPLQLRLGPAGCALTLTAFNSGHCPGSLALLLEWAHGRVFHTGDWRREEPLPAALLAEPLDALFLDNTFCHPSYTHPPRADALALLLARVGAWREAEAAAGRAPGRLLLGCDALGKEEVLLAVAEAAGGLVAVSRSRLAVVRALRLPEGHLTTWPQEAAVLTAPRWRFDVPRVGHVCPPPPEAEAEAPVTLALLPTGWPAEAASAARGGVGGARQAAAAARAMPYEAVPYSLHASFPELRALVHLLRPARIVGLVASPRFADRPTDPNLHFGELLRPGAGRQLPPLPPRPRPPPPQPPPPPRYGTDESEASMLARARRSVASRAMQGAEEGRRMAGAARAGARLAPLSDSDEERENVSKRAKQECVEGVSERAQLAALPQAAAAASS